MSKPTDRYGTPRFDQKYLKLRDEWYAKLEESGFDDIEPWRNPSINSYLKDHHIETRKRAERGIETGKSEMFRIMFRWMDIAVWKTRTERWAFACWVAGWDFKEVSLRFGEAVGKANALAGRARTQLKHALAWFRAEDEAELAEMEID